MGRSCTIYPKVKKSDGTSVKSKLFTDMLDITKDRELTKALYAITITDNFKKDWVPKLPLDNNGEPIVASLFKIGLGKHIPDSVLQRYLNQKAGYYKADGSRPRYWVRNHKNYEICERMANNFNRTSPFKDDWVATVINHHDPETGMPAYGVYVQKRNIKYSLQAEQMQFNENLNNKLIEILKSKGISVGVLDELEERLGVNGVTDFSQAKVVTEGLIELIRLAKGERSQKALPEEFAHAALEMLGEHPLISRLYNTLNNESTIKEILGDSYETYKIKYQGNELKMVKEAAGKLVAKYLLENSEIPAKPYKNIISRLIEAIKNFFKNWNASEFQKAMNEATEQANEISRQILNGSLVSKMDVSNIKENEQLFQTTEERVKRDSNILNNIINNEIKRWKIYQARTDNARFDEKQKALIADLEHKLAEHNYIEGIYSYLDNALGTLSSLRGKLIVMAENDDASINEKAKLLRDIRNYLYSYKRIFKDIREGLVEEQYESDDRYGERIEVALKDVDFLLDSLFIAYEKNARPLFVEFIKPFLGKKLVVPFGKDKGKVITAEELVSTLDTDITFFDRWLDSMAESRDYLLKVFDKAVKEYKDKARQETIELSKKIQAIGMKARNAGIDSFEWMFEKDEEGNLTGDYISEIDWPAYRKAKKEMLERLDKKYGKNPKGNDIVAYNKERQDWYDENYDRILNRPASKYESKVFKNLSDAQRKFYNDIMEVKRELDKYLPKNYTYDTNAVKIRKDLIERVKSSSGVKEGTTQLFEAIKDKFLERSDDIDFGTKVAIKDFEGNQVESLPIYYTRLHKGESANDLSTDVVSTMIAYAAMVNDYNNMNKVIDVLELGRDVVRGGEGLTGREVQETKAGKPVIEKLNGLGRTIESKITKTTEKRFLEKLNSFFDMQIYQRYIKDEGTFGDSKISKAKSADVFNAVTAINSLALNALSGISNVATGNTMMRIEAFSKEFFSNKDVWIADTLYGKLLTSYLSELGSAVKTNKLSLFDELFNVMQEYEQDVTKFNFDRKTWVSRMFDDSALYLMNNSGEHWMQNRTALALAHQYKMKGPNGEITNLFDALEVAYIQEDGTYSTKNKTNLGAKLQLKEGYTKEDGSAFTRKDITAFTNKSKAINQKMHGIYNKADKAAIQQIAVGRMAFLFRKWIIPNFNKRYAKSTYNMDTESWTEGYYQTLGRFLLQATKELKQGQFSIAANWNGLTNVEKANIKRASMELSTLLVLAVALALIDWDDDDGIWGLRMLEYQARRLYSEIGAQAPTFAIANEALKIMESPIAGMSTIENTLGLINVLNPYNYEAIGGEDAIMKSGRFKGHNRAYKYFFESPLVPMNKTIYRVIHPESSIPYFKQ